MPTPNNFNLQRELDERSDLDWKFGALSAPALVSIPPAERGNYLPAGETQFDSFADFTDCASRSPVNHMEAIFTYHYQHAMQPENKKWFEDNSYVQNGRITFSDRFIAILSGTTHQGNSLKSPLDAIRTKGLIPKALLPKLDTMTWDDYYDPTKITPALKQLGQDFLARFTLNYEQVAQVHFGDVLKDDMIGVAGFAWGAPDANDVYHSNSPSFNHAFLVYDLPKYQIFDNYLDPADNAFTKSLAPDYLLYDYGYRIYVASEKKSTDIAPSFYDQLIALLAQISALWPSTPVTPSPKPTPPPPVIPKSKIQAWALAIQHEEGGKPNDLNIRNHNPGNLKFTPYTSSLGGRKGPVGSDGGSFCVFDTYDHGFKALCQFLTDAANNQLIPYHDPQYRTLKGFTQHYANPPANHPYAQNVATALGVPVNIQIRSLLTGISSVDNSLGEILSANTMNSMSYSTIFLAVIVNAIVALGNYFHVGIGSDAAMATATVIVNLLTGIWVAYQRTKLQVAPSGVGDVNGFGARR